MPRYAMVEYNSKGCNRGAPKSKRGTLEICKKSHLSRMGKSEREIFSELFCNEKNSKEHQ
jgi:hypothetical protein